MATIAEPLEIAIGPDGNSWSAEISGIGRIEQRRVSAVNPTGGRACVSPVGTAD